MGSQDIVLVEAMVKRKLCNDEALVDLARREDELCLARHRAMIHNITYADPRAVDLIIRTLRAHNFTLTLEKPSGASSLNGAMSRSALAQAARVEKLKLTTHAAATKEMEEKDNKDWVPTKYWTLESLSVTLLISHVLAQVEPQAFSGANLRSMKKYGQAASSKLGLLVLVEYTTGCDGGFELVGPLRYWPYLQSVLRVKSEQRGRRGMLLVLPADWDGKDGVYGLIVEPGTVSTENPSTKKKVVIPALDLPRFDDESDLYIKDNYSETRATIRSRTDVAHGGVPCARYLPEFIAQPCYRLPAPPRIALSRNRSLKMLEDGSATTPPKNKVETALALGSGSPASPFANPEKDTADSAPANTLSPGVGSSSGAEKADKELDGKDKAEEEEKDSRPEETESQGNQSDKMEQGKGEFDDSCQVPPPPVGDS